MKYIIILVVLLDIMAFSSAYLKQTLQGATPIEVAKTPSPDFTWTDFDGKDHNIKDLKGHVVIIHFWATWCAPCRQEFPELLQAAKAYGDDVTFLTVSADDYPKIAQHYIEKQQEATGSKDTKNLLFAFDTYKKISVETFETTAFPESIVLDKDQNLRQKFVGAVHWANPDVMKSIKAYGAPAEKKI